MKTKAIEYLKNLSYTFTSNLVTLIVSSLVVIIVPKIIGVEDYGFWQLYLFYTIYIGFLHFGWNDGIYLRYGGFKYNDINKPLLFSQFYSLLLVQLAIGALIYLSATLYVNNLNRVFVLKMVSLTLIITNVRYMLLFILQATNRFKEYSMTLLFDRISYAIIMIAVVAFGVSSFEILIIIDFIAKCIGFIYIFFKCKDITLRKLSDFRINLQETWTNISIGINLMFAVIASKLIIGVIRFGIERTWDVIIFGKVSLTLSISNLLMVFVNSIGLVLYPILRRTDTEKLPSLFKTVYNFLITTLMGLLLVYYPLKKILIIWLPQYELSLKYMALLFPIFVYEGKMAVLINTYLKALRKEKIILKANLIALTLSLSFAFFFTVIIKNLDLAVLSIVLLLFFRSTYAEIRLTKILGLTNTKNLFLETFLITTFILTGWLLNSFYITLIYGLTYTFYLFIKKDEVLLTIRELKALMKSKQSSSK